MTSPSPSSFLQYRDRIERPTRWRGRRHWVISRSLCAFRGFRLPSTARGDLRNFAAIKAREWAPFVNVGYHLHLTDDAARIWAWDASRVADAMSSVGIARGRVAVVPETAVQARAEDGLRLLACLEGFEGQAWSEGELQASRWWPETPSRQQWRDFQRTAGVPLDPLGDAPSVEAPVWRLRPWTNSGEGLGSSIERRHRELMTAGAGVLLAAYGYVGGSFAHHAQALSVIEDRVRTAEQQAAPVFRDRNQALGNREFLAAFENLNPHPSQLALLAGVAEKLPKNGVRIVAWAYQDGDLQITLLSPVPPDILFYVKTYSAVAGFTDVTADRADSDRSLRLKLRLTR